MDLKLLSMIQNVLNILLRMHKNESSTSEGVSCRLPEGARGSSPVDPEQIWGPHLLLLNNGGFYMGINPVWYQGLECVCGVAPPLPRMHARHGS
jgi:hypothetical protein